MTLCTGVGGNSDVSIVEIIIVIAIIAVMYFLDHKYTRNVYNSVLSIKKLKVFLYTYVCIL